MARSRIALLIAALVASGQQALANPTGPTVVNGTANFATNGAALTVTNSPNAIINWQGFSIGAGEITRFNQQSAISAVLNRVTTQNPSSILGKLQSNGRVFLINPGGIVFGAGSQVDVGGLVASTLNLSDADFLAGRLRFMETPGAGPVVNNGTITTAGAGAPVYLIGPAVTNGGLITSPRGEVLLAAGNTVEVFEPGTPNLRVELTAPSGQALNIGSIIARSGGINIFAGAIRQSGVLNADTAVAGPDGRIFLRSTSFTRFGEEGVASHTSATGGSIVALAGDLEVRGDIISRTQALLSQAGFLVTPAFAGGSVRIRGQVAAAVEQPDQVLSAGGSLRLEAQDGRVEISSAGTQSVSAANIIALHPENQRRATTRMTAAAQFIAVRGDGNLVLQGPGVIEIAATTGDQHIDFQFPGVLILDGARDASLRISAERGSQLITGSPRMRLTGNEARTVSISARRQTIDASELILNSAHVTATGGEQNIDVQGGTVQGFIVPGEIAINAGAGGSAGLRAGGNQTIEASGNITVQGGEGRREQAFISSGGDINLTVGGLLFLNEGAGDRSWARVQTDNRSSSIGLRFPNLTSGGWFVNGVEGAIRQGQSGFFSGNRAAVFGRQFLVIYGEE